MVTQIGMTHKCLAHHEQQERHVTSHRYNLNLNETMQPSSHQQYQNIAPTSVKFGKIIGKVVNIFHPTSQTIDPST